MQPTNEIAEAEFSPRKLPKIEPGDEVVISGMAGRFPESNNVAELHENLMNKRDLITDDDRRWKHENPDIPHRSGKLNGLDKFDALFFGVHYKQASVMDPIARILLEHTYEAIVDAGINPQSLRGTKTGVFIGASLSETEQLSTQNKSINTSAFGVIGSARSMFANRISYWLGTIGPSYSVDTACSSSLYALEHAYRAISDGSCDAAIVGTGQLCLNPCVTIQFANLGVLSADGRCKVFDESADGYVRSETISVLFLQKAKDAKRVYATVVHGKTNCDGYKEQSVTFPSSLMQSILLKEVYAECGVPPSAVDYVEAHGTGTTAGDPVETYAIDKIFSPGRKTPLKIGSIKSNLGHTEPASGLNAVIKVVLAMESGIIPPNINFKNPRKQIKPLIDGTLRVVTEPTPWDGGYAAINSFGFGGANAHVLLKSNTKEKINKRAPNDNLPRLVALSGRTEEAVTNIINYLSNRPVDVEYIGLLHNIHSEDVKGHFYRGYTILPSKETSEKPLQEIVEYSDSKRPIWFVYSGMGSQWPGMGEALLQIPVFADAIKKCDAVLQPLGIDIFHIITNKEKTAFDNILNSFIGIAACQIGLTDILRVLGINPDYIIGHSVGELGCAYADDCFTAEQMILAAYSRGLASIESQFIHGSMAAIGLGYKNIKNLCPPDIEVACHNSAESSTISGPAESMKSFVANLQANKIFAKEVSCANIPYHSRYIASAGPKLLAYLQKIIPDPKVRSPKWISTSVTMEKWDTTAARYSSAEYHTNNLLNPVLFEESSALIPKNAITIEIAPHGLLQAIIRRSLAPTVTNIALTQRCHANNAEFLLQSIGKMYNVGLQPQIANIYPPIQFPVSRSTPMISPLIKWQHSDEWFVASFQSEENGASGQRQVEISITKPEFESMSGHVIDGRNLFPATGYLTLVWETMGIMKGKHYSEVSVVFKDVKFIRATPIPSQGNIHFTVTISKGTGRFEIVESDTTIVSGYIYETNDPTSEKLNPPMMNNDKEEESMTTDDIYKELRLHGYDYTGSYRGITSATTNGLRGHLKWNDDWISYMDTMLQMHILGLDTRSLFVPTGIKKLVIDTKAHRSLIHSDESAKAFPVYVDKKFDVIVCGGVEIRGVSATPISKKKPAREPILEEYTFIAHTDRNEVSLEVIARLSMQICVETLFDIKVKTIELIDSLDDVSSDNLLSPLVAGCLSIEPLIQAEVNIASTKKYKDLIPNILETEIEKLGRDNNALLAVGHCLLTEKRTENLNLLLSSVKNNGFLLTRESSAEWSDFEKVAQSRSLDVIFEKKCRNESILLLRKRNRSIQNMSVVFVDNNNFSWVDDMKKIMSAVSDKKSNKSDRVIFVGQGDFENGLIGFMNCLRKEPDCEIVRGILIQDPKAEKFSLENPLYAKQLERDLTICVLRENGVWGSYRHLPLAQVKPTLVQHAVGNQKTWGDLSSLAWHEGHLGTHYKCPNVINVYYSALNFRDVMIASGKLAIETFTTDRLEENILGSEYSGINASGKRIMGLVKSKAISNLVIEDPCISWEIPNDWSLEDAATVPCVYATCCHALEKYGNMKKGDKILIHAGSGGVGQAAINLALHEGCEVFTTVGTPHKRRFIRDTFPEIPESHIGNSRDTSFEKMILEQTNGRGVDIVLNSLAEEKLQASIRCLAKGGRFLEIGKFDLVADNELGMKIFLHEIVFYGIRLDTIFYGTSAEKIEVRNRVLKKLKAGAVKPIVRTVFPKEEIETTFRYMAAGKHIGKVLLKIRNENEPIDSPMKALPKYHCYEDHSYVILGGLGGFGLELADWLILRGARNLVLTSRRGITNGYQKMRINLWQSYGARILIVVEKEASKLEDCEYILKEAAALGPVDGVFNLAVVLKDALWSNQTSETFAELFRCKAWATKNLDILTRNMCPQLRHFVVFSSVSCGRGNAGQMNYGMANSVMERVCEKRVAEGFPALAIQWGSIRDVGLLTNMKYKEEVIGGTLKQDITSCLQKLDEFMVQNRTIVSSMIVAEKTVRDAKAVNLIETVLNIMNLKDLKEVSSTLSLAEIGVDSMMSVEIKQTLEREFQIFLTSQAIQKLNFSKLQEMNDAIAKDSKQKLEGTSKDIEIIQGLEQIVKIVGTRDINYTPCLKLPSNEEEGKQEIFFIPGVEGLAPVFEHMTPHIRARVYCLQLDLHDNKSIADMARNFLPHVLEKQKNRRQCRIVGYSYGACIAIELMRLLEVEGMDGQLILIDGAPEHGRFVVKEYCSHESTEEFENKIIFSMMNNSLLPRTPELIADLKKCKCWDDKLDAIIPRVSTEAVDMSVENQKLLLTAVYTRLVALKNYDVSESEPINASIILLKPTTPSIRGGSNDYGLLKVTSGKVEVLTVDGNHVSILDNAEVVKIINNQI